MPAEFPFAFSEDFFHQRMETDGSQAVRPTLGMKRSSADAGFQPIQLPSRVQEEETPAKRLCVPPTSNETEDIPQEMAQCVHVDKNYNQTCAQYYSSKQTQEKGSEDAMEAEGTASPETCRQYVVNGGYSPRTVFGGYCRPCHFYYHDDIY